MSNSNGSQTLVVAKHCPKELQPDSAGWCLNDFVLVKKLGVGGASAVYQAIHRRSRACVALKLYFKSKLTALNTHQVQREVTIHSRLNHPSIISLDVNLWDKSITLVDSNVPPSIIYGAFQDKGHVALIIEFAAKGDLFDLLRHMGGRMKEADVVSRVMAPFMLGLAYLHNLGIIHRDIKLENTLFSSDGTLKIADFGLSVDANVEAPVTRLGTLDYMSPEVMICPDKRLPSENKESSNLKYGAKVDAWACGVLAYELLVGCPPFGMSTREASVRAVLYQAPKTPQWLPAAATDFIRWALTKKASPRPTVAQLLQHSWILSHMRSAGRVSIKQATQSPSQPSSIQNPLQPMSCGLQSNDGTSHGLTTMSLNSVNSTSSAVQAALADPLSVGALQQRPDAIARTQHAHGQPSSIHSVHSQAFASQPSSTQSMLPKHHSVTTGAQALLHAAHALPDLPPVQNYHSVHASMDLSHKAQHAAAAANRSGMHGSTAMPHLAVPLQIHSSSTLGTDLASTRSQEVWGSLSGLNPPGSGASSAVARSPPDSMGRPAQRNTWNMYQQQAAAYTATGQPMAPPNSYQSSSFSPPMPMERIAAPLVPPLMGEPATQQGSDLSARGGPTLATTAAAGMNHPGSLDAAANATAAWVASAMQDLSGGSSLETMPSAPQSGASIGGNSAPMDTHSMDAQLAALVSQLQQQYGDNVTLGLLESALGRALSPAEAAHLQHAAYQASLISRTDERETKAEAASPSGGSRAAAAHPSSVFVHPDDMRKSCWGNMQSMLASHGTVTSGTEYALDSPTTQLSLKALEGAQSTHGASAPGSYRHSASPDNAGQLMASMSGGTVWEARPESINSGCAAQSPHSVGAQRGSQSAMRDAAMQDISGDGMVLEGAHMRYPGGAGMVCDDMMDAMCPQQRVPGQLSGQLEPVAEGLTGVQQAFLVAQQRWGAGQRDLWGGAASHRKPR